MRNSCYITISLLIAVSIFLSSCISPSIRGATADETTAIVASTSSCLISSAATTVDIYQTTANSMTNTNNDKVIDSLGNIFIYGTGNDASGNQHWIVRKSIDNGSTWTVVDNFQYAIGDHSYPRGILSDPITGYLFVYGNSFDNTWTNDFQIIRKSTDHGATWTTDAYQYLARNTDAGYGFFAPDGSIIILGNGTDAGGTAFSIIRKSTDNGTSWSLVDAYQATPNALTNIHNDKVIDSLGSIFVYGTGSDASGNEHLIVRKSTDNGSTWTLVDNFQYAIGDHTYPRGLIADPITGYLYTYGNSFDNTWTNDFQIIRKSTDHGATWTTDAYQYLARNTDAGYGFFAPDGSIIILGNGTDAGGTAFSIIRKSTDNGTSWSLVDAYQATANALTNIHNDKVIDSLGSIFVYGTGSDASGNEHLIVRKSTDNGSTWTLVDNFQYRVADHTYPRGLIADPITGYLYTYGNSFDNSWANDFQIIRKSTDHGATWTTDAYQYLTRNTDAGYGFFALDRSIIIMGNSEDAGGTPLSITRKYLCQ